MERYKICPYCKTKNDPILFECLNCEADLTGVKITDEETEKQSAKQDSSSPVSSKPMVRLCDCGTKNAPNARKCSSCNEDISDITPTPDVEEGEAKEKSFMLSSLDGRFAYKITSEETIVGRENTMSEYLSGKGYVSRIHAKIIIENNELYIENLSNTNFTYVNNERIVKRTVLQDGDEIGLGGTSTNGTRQEQAAYFIVRIGSCM